MLRRHKTVEIKFFLNFLLVDERIRIQEAQKLMDSTTLHRPISSFMSITHKVPPRQIWQSSFLHTVLYDDNNWTKILKLNYLSMRMGGESLSTSGNLRVTVLSVTTGSRTGSFSSILMRDWTKEARFALYLPIETDNQQPINDDFHVILSSVADPHWFQCGSGPALYLNADPDPYPNPGEPNQYGSMRIRILIRL